MILIRHERKLEILGKNIQRKTKVSRSQGIYTTMKERQDTEWIEGYGC